MSMTKGIFRTRLGADPPACLQPIVNRLRPDAIHIRVKVRQYLWDSSSPPWVG